MSRNVLLHFALACLICLGSKDANLCQAWGFEGHSIVCIIAQKLLTPSANTKVGTLLEDQKDGQLAPLCSWADWALRGQKGAPFYPWSRPLHYTDSQCSTANCRGDVCSWHYKEDCTSHKVKGACVAGAINNYTRQLSGFNDNGFLPQGGLLELVAARLGVKEVYNLTEALLFVAHFVGDAHQPLHAGFLHDRGGNSIRVDCEFCHSRRRSSNTMTNLHSVWDSGIINHALTLEYGDVPAMANELLDRLQTGEYATKVEEWSDCGNTQFRCSSTYCMESEELACNEAYFDENGDPVKDVRDLDEDYYNTRLPIVEQRLAQAGLRLANLLNGVLSDPTYRSSQR